MNSSGVILRCVVPSSQGLFSCHGQLAAAGVQHGFKVVNFTDLLVRWLCGEPREDAMQAFRAIGHWCEISRRAGPQLAANGIEFDADALAAVLPEVFGQAEFRGGLQSFAEPTRQP